MSVLSFCSEKQNGGWLVTGKTPVLLPVGNVSTPNRSDRLASETPEQRQIRLQSMSARNAVRVALIQRKIILRHKRSSELHEHYNYVYSSENILLF